VQPNKIIDAFGLPTPDQKPIAFSRTKTQESSESGLITKHKTEIV
jgi:hypothetical protein